jgi:hypothetical protein
MIRELIIVGCVAGVVGAVVWYTTKRNSLALDVVAHPNSKSQRIEHSLSTQRTSQQFLLDLEKAGVAMKRVYLLSTELDANPQQVELTRKLTLDKTRPTMGLKGTYGLFASDEWWSNINSRKMPLKFVSGTVTRALEAGQDQVGINNTVVLQLSDGQSDSVGIYVNNPSDVSLFKNGAFVMIVYALDELKSGAHNLGETNLEVALEMAVSAGTNP